MLGPKTPISLFASVVPPLISRLMQATPWHPHVLPLPLSTAAKPKGAVVTPTCGQKRKHGGRGGDRRSPLYLLQCRMGQIPLAKAINK